MTEYAKEGYLFYRVVTPMVAVEFELPKDGNLVGDNAKKWKRLQDIAEIHQTGIYSSTYRTL